MIELVGNIFKPSTYSIDLNPDAICITTNGHVTSRGLCVMGRGVAYQYSQINPTAKRTLAKAIRKHGWRNGPFEIGQAGKLYKGKRIKVLSFMTKPDGSTVLDSDDLIPRLQTRFPQGTYAPGWAFKSSIEVIVESAKNLVMYADRNAIGCCIIPRPGCSNGGLEWGSVKPEIAPILDERFFIIDRR